MDKVVKWLTYTKGNRMIEIFDYQNGMLGARIIDKKTGLVESSTLATTERDRIEWLKSHRALLILKN